MRHFATIQNPKTGEHYKCYMSGTRGPRILHPYYTVAVHGKEVSGEATLHLSSDPHFAGGDVDASEGVTTRGAGAGAVLYMALALAADHLRSGGGYIYSRESYASHLATRLWWKLVRHGVATYRNDPGTFRLTAEDVRDTGLVVWEAR